MEFAHGRTMPETRRRGQRGGKTGPYGVGARNAVKPRAIHPTTGGHVLASLSRHSSAHSIARGRRRPSDGRARQNDANRLSRSTVCSCRQARRVRRAAILAALISADVAQPQTADCARLRQAISDASHNDQNAQYQAAAQRQREELDRTNAYARSVGCDAEQFLFFGSPPPPQCGQINAQIERMRANLDELQSRAGGGPGGRGELIARYNAQCVNAPSQPNFPRPCSAGPPDRVGTNRYLPGLDTRKAVRRQSRRSARRIEGRLRPFLRRQLLPGFVFGEPRAPG